MLLVHPTSYIIASYSDLVPLTQDEIDTLPAISNHIDPLTNTMDRSISASPPVTTVDTDIVQTTIVEDAFTNAETDCSYSTTQHPEELVNTDNNHTEMDNNDDSNIKINDNHTVDATSRFGRGDLIQIKSGADWKTVRIESRYRHKYARNRAKYRFKYLGNTNSATVYQDFNKISWR